MINYNDTKNNQIKIMFFTLKILALFFSAIPLFQYFYARLGDLTNSYYGSLVSMGIGLVIIFVVMFIWISFFNRQLKRTSFQIIEMLIFFAMFVFAIYLSGASESDYKFLFLFIIVSYTIEYGMKTGLLIATISAVLVLGIDLIFGAVNSVNYNFENDLALAAMFLVVAWTLGFYVKLEKNHIEQLVEYANIDGLTGLYNHRYFHRCLSEMCDESKKNDKQLSLLIMDIDYFKSYNDIYGHQKGDELLKEFSGIIKKTLRPDDVVCRYGGDEFCIVLPETDREHAGEIAGTLRDAVSEYYFEGQEYLPSGNLTVSVGVSTLSNQTETYNALIDTADSALYRAKFMRRNKVEVYSSVFDQFAGMGGDKQIEENLRSLKTLITVINSRDTYTYKHVERVVNYCGIMADFLGLSIEDRRNLIYSAYLHDLGKINISKEVLVSDQKLTPEEWEELKRHPQDSADIIKQIDGLSELAPIVLQHHEKYDGSGYPSGIAGEEILYLARLLTVIDSFDAMTNQRPYQKIKTFDEAFEEIKRCKGTHFDPELAEQFIEAIKSL